MITYLLAAAAMQPLVVANSGWEAALKGEIDRLEGAVILAIPLGPDCKPTSG